jgi:2-aminoethylphosphonate-pyruvate transaminase
MHAILLNPGPVTLSEGVRRAAVRVDLCHREPEFFDMQERVRQGLLGVYGLNGECWKAVLLGGSGTTALEAMLASLLPRDARLLVIENGVYGERISRIAVIHGVAFEALHHEWMQAPDFDAVEKRLADGEFTHVAAVHHETTTGRLNDVHRLAAMCEAHSVGLLLDAVSSFGAEDIPFESPALVACAATANKCLHGIPGLCFVIARNDALARSVEPPRSLTLHLPLWAEKQDAFGTPFTPSVNGFLALEAALGELRQQGGWRARQARYENLASRVARNLARLGVEEMLPAGESSCVLHAYRLPDGMTYEALHDALKERGFVIYAGQGSLVAEMFRISTMGDISDWDMERLLSSLGAVFS